jgi:hypothetical protein
MDYDFPIILGIIIPTDELIFFRGVRLKPPTSINKLAFWWFWNAGNLNIYMNIWGKCHLSADRKTILETRFQQHHGLGADGLRDWWHGFQSVYLKLCVLEQEGPRNYNHSNFLSGKNNNKPPIWEWFIPSIYGEIASIYDCFISIIRGTVPDKSTRASYPGLTSQSFWLCWEKPGCFSACKDTLWPTQCYNVTIIHRIEDNRHNEFNIHRNKLSIWSTMR